VALLSDAGFILDNAHRLITVASRCVFSFGSGDGLNDLLLLPDDPHGEWRQPIAVLHRDALMMAALRVSILLDRDDQMVSFQAVYRLLKDPNVMTGLLQTLEDRHGPDILSPSRTELIDEFRHTYQKIDWKVHGRLVHLRNRGIAHLTPEEMKHSVTMSELRTLVEIVSQLTAILQQLCQSQMAFNAHMLEEYRDLAKNVIGKSVPIRRKQDDRDP
jgi:hypothetical protein